MNVIVLGQLTTEFQDQTGHLVIAQAAELRGA
jgi:hypothetical protein